LAVIDAAEFEAFAACSAEMFVLIAVICGLQGKKFYQIDRRLGHKQGGCQTLKRQNSAGFKRNRGKYLPFYCYFSNLVAGSTGVIEQRNALLSGGGGQQGESVFDRRQPGWRPARRQPETNGTARTINP
jgi:hypothetical protein